MAKYEKWIEQEGLLLIEGWARTCKDRQLSFFKGYKSTVPVRGSLLHGYVTAISK